MNALGFAAGPLIGGFMLNHFWWGAIFLINLPVAALGLAAVVVLAVFVYWESLVPYPMRGSVRHRLPCRWWR